MNSAKTPWTVLISVAAGMPMFIWLVLGESGLMGEFGETQVYSVIKWTLIGLTCAFYFIVSPFIIWPRIYNGNPNSETDSDKE